MTRGRPKKNSTKTAKTTKNTQNTQKEENGQSKIQSIFYNEDYFENGISAKKSSYNGYVWEDKYLNMAQDLINEFSPTKVLDVGCAKGFLVRAFQENNILAYGCDVSKYAIDNCDTKIKNFVINCDITNLKPYRTEAFDLVIVYDILEHLTDDELELALMELNRVTMKDGIITIKTPPEKYDWDNDKSHINIKPLNEWIKLIKKYGFVDFKPKAQEKYWGAFDYTRTLFFKKINNAI